MHSGSQVENRTLNFRRSTPRTATPHRTASFVLIEFAKIIRFRKAFGPLTTATCVRASASASAPRITFELHLLPHKPRVAQPPFMRARVSFPETTLPALLNFARHARAVDIFKLSEQWVCVCVCVCAVCVRPYTLGAHPSCNPPKPPGQCTECGNLYRTHKYSHAHGRAGVPARNLCEQPRMMFGIRRGGVVAVHALYAVEC